MTADDYPLLSAKDYAAASTLTPSNLLREARRQKNLPDVPIPAVVMLDPDGDIVRYLVCTGRGVLHPGWACYHTELWTTNVDGVEIGVVGMAVGAPFAVLVAEQLAASGCHLVVSVTSAGQITPIGPLPAFVLIDRALRDEGTSTHYLPPGRWSYLSRDLGHRLTSAYDDLPAPVLTGASWTTDAPYRETQAAIETARALRIACVEMEAAALYAYAQATSRLVVCIAHITNTMAVNGEDFEKGVDNGVHDALLVVRATAVGVGVTPATPRTNATRRGAVT